MDNNFLGLGKKVPFRGTEPDFSTRVENDDFERLVFAPDPGSGNPCSSLAYLAKGNDEVADYVREHFFGGNTSEPTGTNGIEDGELALELASNLGESPSVYMQRVSELISKMNDEKK